jgi:protein-ribulosamine 3-kinase
MTRKIDPAILKALSLEAASTTMASHGGSGFASTFKITSTGSDGQVKLFFVKQGRGKGSEIMFAGKKSSFNSMSEVISGEEVSLTAPADLDILNRC